MSDDIFDPTSLVINKEVDIPLVSPIEIPAVVPTLVISEKEEEIKEEQRKLESVYVDKRKQLYDELTTALAGRNETDIPMADAYWNIRDKIHGIEASLKKG